MRSEREAEACEEPSHTCCPQQPTQLADYTSYCTTSSPQPGCQPGEWPNMCQEELCHLNLMGSVFEANSGVKSQPAENNRLVCGKVKKNRPQCFEILSSNKCYQENMLWLWLLRFNHITVWTEALCAHTHFCQSYSISSILYSHCASFHGFIYFHKGHLNWTYSSPNSRKPL